MVSLKKSIHPLLAVALSMSLWAAGSAFHPLHAQELLWESQGLTDENAVASGSVFNYNGATVTVTWSVTDPGGIFSTYAGGTGSTGGGNDYVTFEASQEGAHTGLLLMAFDSSAYDKTSFITLTLTFSTAQTGLAFSLLDLDSVDEAWDDLVDMVYNGTTNVRANTALWEYAAAPGDRTVVGDNEPAGFTGWEGAPAGNPDGTDNRANPDENFGNVDVDFTGISINSITITFRSTDDGDAGGADGGDPGGQKIGISDLFITLIPEPATGMGTAFLGVLAVLKGMGRRESRARVRAI